MSQQEQSWQDEIGPEERTRLERTVAPKQVTEDPINLSTLGLSCLIYSVFCEL